MCNNLSLEDTFPLFPINAENQLIEWIRKPTWINNSLPVVSKRDTEGSKQRAFIVNAAKKKLETFGREHVSV